MALTNIPQDEILAALNLTIVFDDRDPVTFTYNHNSTEVLADISDLDTIASNWLDEIGDTYSEDDSIIEDIILTGGTIGDDIKLHSESKIDRVVDFIYAIDEYGYSHALDYLKIAFDNDVDMFHEFQMANDFVGFYDSDTAFLREQGIDDVLLIEDSDYSDTHYSTDQVNGEVAVFTY